MKESVQDLEKRVVLIDPDQRIDADARKMNMNDEASLAIRSVNEGDLVHVTGKKNLLLLDINLT